jgi:hypothetical protein
MNGGHFRNIFYYKDYYLDFFAYFTQIDPPISLDVDPPLVG